MNGDGPPSPISAAPTSAPPVFALRATPRQADHRPPPTVHRPPPTAHRPPSSAHRPPTTDHRPPCSSLVSITPLSRGSHHAYGLRSDAGMRDVCSNAPTTSGPSSNPPVARPTVGPVGPITNSSHSSSPTTSKARAVSTMSNPSPNSIGAGDRSLETGDWSSPPSPHLPSPEKGFASVRARSKVAP